MNNWSKILLAAGVLAGALSVGTESRATASSSIAVGSCQKSTATGVIAFLFSGMYNTSTSEWGVVDCSPDNATGTVTSADGAKVFVDDRSSSLNVTCNFEIMDVSTGLLSYDGGQKVTSGTGTNIQLLWTKTFMPLSYTGKPYFSCQFPPASGSNYSGIHGLSVGQT